MLAALVGCTTPQSIEGKVNDLLELRQAEVQTECACFAELGYADPAACEADLYTAPDGSQTMCLVEAYSRNEDAARPYLDCLYGAEALYAECLETMQDCSDANATAPCSSDYASNVQTCTAPASLRQAADACVPS